jgi:hypothetical protein
MSSIRDSNLYTLLIRPSPDYPNVLQLIDNSRGSEVRYLRVKEDNSLTPDGKPKVDYAAGGYDAGLYGKYLVLSVFQNHTTGAYFRGNRRL